MNSVSTSNPAPYFAAMLSNGASNSTSGTAEVISVAIANNTIKVATENMKSQYSGFIEFLA